MSTLYNGFLEVAVAHKILAVSIIHHYPIFSAVSFSSMDMIGDPFGNNSLMGSTHVHPTKWFPWGSVAHKIVAVSIIHHYPILSAVSSVLWMWSGIHVEIILWWVHPCPPYKMVSLRCCCPQNSSCIHYPIFSAVFISSMDMIGDPFGNNSLMGPPRSHPIKWYPWGAAAYKKHVHLQYIFLIIK